MAGKNFDISRFASTIKPVPDSDTAWIALGDIYLNPKNFYPKPDPKALEDLAEPIDANGILEPPTVIRDGEQFRLISGHSRIEAVHLLEMKAPEDPRWSKVLCRILPPMTEDQELTAVIEANRQRVKPNWILAEEADRLTKAYTKRKEAGEELPGRIRDRVAEALQVNKTKLANLSAIKNGLKVPGIIEAWKQQRIPEAAALEIARMDLNTQYRLLDWMIDKGRSYTINEVRMFRTVWSCCREKCPETAGFCPNAERMYNVCYRGGAWNCAGCCKSCLKADSCPAVCKYARKDASSKAGIAAPPEKKPLNPATKDPRLDYRTQTPTFCKRVRELRAKTGLSRKEFAESIGEYPGTYSAWENASMAGSGSVPKLALCLGTTTDYLFGLTDDPKPPAAQPEGQLIISGWMPGGTNPREPCYAAAILDFGGDQPVLRKIVYWDGAAWRFRPNGETMSLLPAVWMALPDYSKEVPNDTK